MTIYSAVVVIVLAGAAVGIRGWLVARARHRHHATPRASSSGDSSGASESGAAAGVASKQLGDLYRSVFQSLADALVVIDDHGLIRSFSPSAERTFGYAAAEVIGRNVSTLMPPPDRDNHEEYLRRYVESGWASGRMETLVLTGDAHIIRPERETVAVRKDGTLFPARLIVSELDTDGTRFFVGLITDVSERKRLEREVESQVASQKVLLEQLRDAYAVIEGQKQRMQYELDVGREIQLSMVPHRFPTMAEAELWGALRPAREVGGDFYDFFTGPSGLLWLCIGDVSGKGVPAALLMGVTKTLISAAATRDGTPGEVLTRVNDELTRDNESAMFVSAFVACLDLRSGEMRYANAGHNPPFVRRGSGRVDRLNTRHGPVLGALEGVRYGDSVFGLVAGDTLLLYTDGVTEALDPDTQLFSEARLRVALSSGEIDSAASAVNAVVTAVEAFAGGAEQADDITVLALRFLGGAAPRTDEQRHAFSIVTRFEALADAVTEVEGLVGRCGGDATMQRRFALAFDELVSNIIKYAYPAGGDHVIDCEIARRDGVIEAVIVDDGVPFNPLGLPEPDTTSSLEARQIGGLGVLIVRRMFDEVRNERHESRNVTTIVQRMQMSRNADSGSREQTGTTITVDS